jgi:hypothetical protein
MNDFSELENELRNLRPVQPSPELINRIERALAEPETSTAGVLPRERRFHFNWLSLGLGLAAAAALVLFATVQTVQLERPAIKNPNVASVTPAPAFSSATASPQFVPAGLTQVVYRTRDEGVHFPNNSQQPMRRMRSHTRETLQWHNPKTGATLRISYPTEQVSLSPVSGQ